jgi:hypothetical protein
MSRRAKLLITALFLVLLGIPAVYTVLLWSIEQPLHYRYVTALPEEMLRGYPNLPPETCIPVVFEVQNTKSYPVYIANVSIQARPQDSSERVQYRPLFCFLRSGLDESVVPTLYAKSIPAHSVIRFEVLMHPEAARALATEDVKIFSYLASPPRKWAMDVENWLRRSLPKLFRLGEDPLVPIQDSAASLKGPPVSIPRPTTSSAPSASPP